MSHALFLQAGKVTAEAADAAAGIRADLPHINPPRSNVLLTDRCTPIALRLAGKRLAAPGVKIIARSGNWYTALSTQPCDHSPDAVTVHLPVASVPLETAAGSLVWLEAAYGSFLSSAIPLLVSPDVYVASKAAAISVELVARRPLDGAACARSLLLSLGTGCLRQPEGDAEALPWSLDDSALRNWSLRQSEFGVSEGAVGASPPPPPLLSAEF
jgi:hypothetical protein